MRLLLQKQIEHLQAQHDQAVLQMARCEGALKLARHLLEHLEKEQASLARAICGTADEPECKNE